MKKIAAIYARVSSDKQKNDNTIESQIAEIVEFANKSNFHIPDELRFLDDGFSGYKLVRPALERLRDLVQKGEIEVVLVYAPDRLARNFVHQELIKEEFKKNGVNLIFVKSPSADTPEQKLMMQFQGMIAEYERELITERTRRGRLHRAKLGYVSVLSSAPFGYRYVKKTAASEGYYEINETEAVIVREIFKLYTEDGYSLSRIVRHLMEKNYIKRKGSTKWTRSVLRTMLRNPAYRGEACYGKTSKKERPCTPVTRRKNRSFIASNYRQSTDRESWIPIAVPAIVSKKTYDIAQTLLETNKKLSPRNTKEPSLLQGLVVCGACQRSYFKKKYKSGNRTLAAYRCMGSNRSYIEGMKPCKNGSINLEELDRQVWEHVVELLKNPITVKNEIERRAKCLKNAQEYSQRKAELTKKLKRLNLASDNLLDLYQEECISFKDMRERISKIKQDKNVIEKELREIEHKEVNQEMLNKISLNVDSFLAQLSKSIEDLTILEKQRIIRLIVKQISIGWKKNGEREIIITHCIPTREMHEGLTIENLQLCTGRVSI